MAISAPLTKMHREERLKWTSEHVTFSEEDWNSVVFSDENEFNLDVPDGMNHYWNHIGTDRKVVSLRHQGGGSVMFWSCFSYHSLNNLVVFIGNQDSTKYFLLLRD